MNLSCFSKGSIISIIQQNMAQSLGYAKARFKKMPDIEFRTGWFDLSDGDHNAKVENDELLLELWFRRDFFISDDAGNVVLKQREGQIKVDVSVKLSDVEYLMIDGQRFWLDEDWCL